MHHGVTLPGRHQGCYEGGPVEVRRCRLGADLGCDRGGLPHQGPSCGPRRATPQGCQAGASRRWPQADLQRSDPGAVILPVVPILHGSPRPAMGHPWWHRWASWRGPGVGPWLASVVPMSAGDGLRMARRWRWVAPAAPRLPRKLAWLLSYRQRSKRPPSSPGACGPPPVAPRAPAGLPEVPW